MKLVRHMQWLFSAVLLVAVGLAAWHWKRAQDPMAFVNHWGEIFRQHSTPEAFHQLAVVERPDLIYLRRFDNGEWVAARTEYSCTGGAGFDATVFLDSHGVIRFQVGHHFCGYEGLCSELREIKADTVAEFYTRMTDVQVRIWDVNSANNSVEPTGGSRRAQIAFVTLWRLPPVAHACR
jgi:hypothetical protein